MDYLCLEGVDAPVRALVVAFDEEELEPGKPEDVSAYHHLRLAEPDLFSDVDELSKEHLIFTTAPYPATQQDLNVILDETLGLSREMDTVRVLAVTPEIARKLRQDPLQPHTFKLEFPLPIVIVLLGGTLAIDQWKGRNLGNIKEEDG